MDGRPTPPPSLSMNIINCFIYTEEKYKHYLGVLSKYCQHVNTEKPYLSGIQKYALHAETTLVAGTQNFSFQGNLFRAHFNFR